MPWAVTPIRRRVPSSVLTAQPWSVYSSWVWMPETGAGLCSGKRASTVTSARRAPWRSRTSWAMCSASVSALNGDSPRTTSPIASLTTSSKRDMCAPFWSGPSSTTHSKRAENSCSDAVLAEPDHLLDAGHADLREAQLDRRQLRLDVRPSRRSVDGLEVIVLRYRVDRRSVLGLWDALDNRRGIVVSLAGA